MALTGAAVAAVLGELVKSVAKIQGKIEEYNSVLERIETTVKRIEPIVKQIHDLNVKLDGQGEQTKQFWGEIQRGKDLIQCCKDEIGGCCSCFKKQQYQYLGKLQELDESLSSFYNIVVPLHTLWVTTKTGEITEDVRKKVVENQASLKDLHGKVDKILAKNNSNNSAADASNKFQRQGSSQARPSGYASGDETRSASPSAPARNPERSVTPVPDQRKQVPGEYGRVNSKEKGAATSSSGTVAISAIPANKGKESPPIPQTSGFGQVKPNLEEDRHQDQTKRPTTTALNVPSPPPKSPEVVRETKRNGPAQILPYQDMDSPRHLPHVQPEPRQVKQVPDKVKQEPAYTYFPDNSSKAAISPVASNDSIRGASFAKDSPSRRHSSYPVKPADPATANYGFGTPPKSPETKAISPAHDRYWNAAPTTTTTIAHPAPPRPYIPPDSPSSGKNINLKGRSSS